MKIKEYVKRIVDNGKPEDMERLSDMLDETIIKLKIYDEKCYDEYKMDLYEMAYGKKITLDMADSWVKAMTPRAKWAKEETDQVLSPYGINLIDGYVVMNMLYSDMKNVLGTGDDEESLNRYIQATQDWLNDSDADEDKLYNYYKYIIK